MRPRRTGVALVAAVWAMAFPDPAVSQVASGSELRLSLGVAVDAHSDLLATPFRQTGSGIAGALELVRGGLSVTLSGSVATTTSELPTHRGGNENVWAGGLEARYLKDVGEVAGLRGMAGLGLGAVGLARRHHYPEYRNANTEIFGDLLIPLSAVGALVWEGDGGTVLEERLEVALLMGAVESPFAGSKYVPSPGFKGLWNTRFAGHRLALSHPLSERLSVRVEHRLRFLDTERARTLRSIQQELVAGLGLRLGGGGS